MVGWRRKKGAHNCAPRLRHDLRLRDHTRNVTSTPASKWNPLLGPGSLGPGSPGSSGGGYLGAVGFEQVANPKAMTARRTRYHLVSMREPSLPFQTDWCCFSSKPIPQYSDTPPRAQEIHASVRPLARGLLQLPAGDDLLRAPPRRAEDPRGETFSMPEQRSDAGLGGIGAPLAGNEGGVSCRSPLDRPDLVAASRVHPPAVGHLRFPVLDGDADIGFAVLGHRYDPSAHEARPNRVQGSPPEGIEGCGGVRA